MKDAQISQNLEPSAYAMLAFLADQPVLPVEEGV
jgi:hypothetical protein